MTVLMIMLRPVENLQNDADISRKNLNAVGLPNSIVMPQRHKENSCQGPQSSLAKERCSSLAKEKCPFKSRL